ncbi:MAG: substrate-binding domain-containing protein [Defluviitaleaceae bacterium]|nr:substrate-binding domain-containing protein [Defluviitaleaceae bacterium]
MKKFLTAVMVILGATVALTACSGNNDDNTNDASNSNFNTNREIIVVTREASSGTRSAFVEIADVTDNGNDAISVDAYVANGTSLVLTTVAGNEYAIGYVSMGSLNNTVRALDVNGIVANEANIVNNTYTLFRPFYVAVQDNLDPLSQTFVDFILSAEGQEIVSGSYIASVENAPAFAGTNLTGTIEVSGSTSVAPIMTRLAEAFTALTGINVDIQSQGSTAGINQARDGSVPIGMSSRELTATELVDVNAIAIAFDGLAIIVHPNNPITDISIETVREIFLGNETRWSGVIN